MLVILLGVVLSLLWCWAGWYYLEMAIGFDNLLLFLPHEIGQFAIGFFTPLFLLWILIALLHLLRRVARLNPPSPGGGSGPAPREPQLEPRAREASPAPASAATTAQETKTQETSAVADSPDANPVKPRDKPEKPVEKPAESRPKGASRAQASATVRTSDAAGNTTLRTVEHSAVSGSGPARAIARAVGRDSSQDTADFEARGSKRGMPPKRPAGTPQPSMPEPEAEAKLPPKRPSHAMTPEQKLELEAVAPDTPAGPLPPKRPPEGNVAALPRSAEGTLPPKNPRSGAENYAAALNHRIKELNAIAMDTAVLLCEPESYQDSREALNDGQDDSFFHLLIDRLERDGLEALAKLRQVGNAELLESYRSKFENLLQAAEQEPDSQELKAQLRTSAPGQLYATIESKLQSNGNRDR
ncbi:MAG: hypothetical protein WDZ84_07895 [Rhodovibrionaceae bacterium]